ncbi:MAG: aminodeoxychorismate synthase component I [Desulfuromonadaceae bacterium]|nr:aminodeoxychorismate synthase component I [Desulfuromonadaceae bacterium]MDD2854185.1 aminodeoxychorismate synthase component I [Desulfuromonadaceae bacterium]
MTPDSPTVLLDSFGERKFTSSWRFDGYIKSLTAYTANEVISVLNQIERAAADGFYAVGFVAYEAAPAINPELTTAPPMEGLPLAWFSIYRERYAVSAGSGLNLTPTELDFKLTPENDIEQYSNDINRILNYIACGDCYQVNHTFSMSTDLNFNLVELYRRLASAQQASFCSFLDIGRFKILSASPELFFSLNNSKITVTPMKGTGTRGRWLSDDLTAIKNLRESTKDRAENLMIVDLLRNDLGIIADTGTVQVDSLFDIETYPTVHQMTSTISAKISSKTALRDIFKAIFPCGSITGAPKRRSMEIIAGTESSARGVYCGTIGFVAPGGEALFSVAIRTLVHDTKNGRVTMGVGSAITWDSEIKSEYSECLGKVLFVNRKNPDFYLIESLRLDNGNYFRMDRHISRLTDSAKYFGFNFDYAGIRKKLLDHASDLQGLFKTRLLMNCDGCVHIESEPLTDDNKTLSVKISSSTVDSKDSMLYHKTTLRIFFENARAEYPDCDEVIFLNERGELTEGSYNSLVINLDGFMLTPLLTSGLLPGVMRAELLDNAKLVERILYPSDLEKATETWLVNSVRGWRRCVLNM